MTAECMEFYSTSASIKRSERRTVIVDLNRDVLKRICIVADKHERSFLLLRRKTNQDILLVRGDVAGRCVELVANHVAR